VNLSPANLNVLASLKERLITGAVQNTESAQVKASMRAESPRRSHVMRAARNRGASWQRFNRSMNERVAR